MKKVLKLVLIFILFSPIKTFADVEAETAGINNAFYAVEWCSPHYKICKEGFFEKDGNVGILSYEGASTSGISINTSNLSTTQTSDVGIVDLFDVTDLKFQGEGIYTINVVLLDNAYNASSYTFTYRIDKTAPQFQLDSIAEDSDYTYIDDRISGLDGSVLKYDSVVNTSSSTDNYEDPSLSDYSGDVPTEQSAHTREDLYPFYYSGNNGSEDFDLNTTYSDDFDGLLDGAYLAGVKSFELIDESGTVIDTKSGVSTTSSFSTSVLNNLDNTQQKYKLRIYDNTEGESGGDGNYSEIIFYVVKDNTDPNTAVTDLIKFDDSNTVWDTSTGDYSRFLQANSSQTLIFNLNDTGINNGSSQPELYNAGIEENEVKINIEKSDDKTSKENIITFANRFENIDISQTKDFSNVDDDRNNGSRKYFTEFESQNSLYGKICDAVGNCLEPELDFRVVAGPLSTTNSSITLEKNGTGDKMYANGDDYYTITTELYDNYGNRIVGVKAVENSDEEIKKIDLKYTFSNGLYQDLTSSSGDGDKLVGIIDNQTDNTTTNSINNDGTIYFLENVEGSTYDTDKGYYSFKINSKVPTSGVYPYLGDSAILLLTGFESKTIENTSGVGIYGNFGNYIEDLNFVGTENLLEIDNTYVTENGNYDTDFSTGATDKTNYGNVTLSGTDPISISNFETIKQIQLEYTPLYIYGAKDFTIHHLVNNIGQFSNHTKEAYKLDSSSVSNIEIYEQYLPSYTDSSITYKKYTPNVFNIYTDLSTNTGTGNVINNGFTISNLNGEEEYKSKSSPMNSSYQVSGNTFYMGYISNISYETGGETIKLPSISRNISGISGNRDDDDLLEKNSCTYFPQSSYEGTGNYTIKSDKIINTGILGSMGVAVTGLINTYNSMLEDDTYGTKAAVNIEESLTRYDLIKTFKTNVSKRSMGVEWCENIGTISNLNSDLGNCTVTIEGEKISFIKGNVDISCSGDTCELNNDLKRTIIVEGGSVYIESNITTYGKNSQLLIGSLAEFGIENIPVSLNGTNPNIDRDESYTYGWMFVDPDVTNIDAYLVAQGPFVSYDGSKLFNEPVEGTLLNQLHLYGGLLSLNTVGGYKGDSDSECPYIVTGTCDSKTAFIFDLITLRRYSLEGESAGSAYLQVTGDGERSGKNKSLLEANTSTDPITINDTDMDINGDCINTNGLRCIGDTYYIIYPLLLENDILWKNDPSIIFEK